MSIKKIINIAIVAHVDHGKTSLIDRMLQSADVLDRKEMAQELILDSSEQEKERGITIFSKVASIYWLGTKINIIDTPGHADFSGEVERVLGIADAFVLLIDSVDGPMPQTRFVAERAIKMGLTPIVVINKIDRQEAEPEKALNDTFDLLCVLGASDEQLDCPIIYCSARYGYSYKFGSIPTKKLKMSPLLDTIVSFAKPLAENKESNLGLQIFQLESCQYNGIVGLGKISSGKVFFGQNVLIYHNQGGVVNAQVKGVFTFVGLKKVKIESSGAGDIVALTGLRNIRVSDFIGEVYAPPPLFKSIEIDSPTVTVRIGVNNSPKANNEGCALQSRELGERLFKEAIHNISLRVKNTKDSNIFEVSGRGELHLGVLIENMRREGLEFIVSRPKVIMDESNDKLEPYAEVFIDCRPEFCGVTINSLADRMLILTSQEPLRNGHSRMKFYGPKRGSLGLRHILLSLTQGTASINIEDAGVNSRIKSNLGNRKTGAMISNGTGKALIHSLYQLQSRGRLMVEHGDMVYDGQIIGESFGSSDMLVNCRQGKRLIRMWRSKSDKEYIMKEFKKLSLEEAMSWVNDDEWIEVTPKSIRFKKDR